MFMSEAKRTLSCELVFMKGVHDSPSVHSPFRRPFNISAQGMLICMDNSTQIDVLIYTCVFTSTAAFDTFCPRI